MSVYLVGVGPGDPELVTVRAVNLLKKADIVYVPMSNVNGRSVAEDIIAPYVDNTKVVLTLFPMTNKREDLDLRYDKLAKRIEENSQEGHTIVYVTLGDPTIYSTAVYLAEKLDERGVAYEVVPGIASFTACSAHAQLSLVERKESFAVVALPETIKEIENYVNQSDTVVFMKVSKRLPILLEYIDKYEPKKAVLVSRVTLDDEDCIDLRKKQNLPDNAGYLSVAIIKKS